MSSEITRQAKNAREPVSGWSDLSADRLREAVKRFGTQAEAAEAASLSRPYLAAVLNGRSVPSKVALDRICQVVGMEKEALFPGFRDPDEADEVQYEDTGSGLDEMVTVQRYRAVAASAGSGLVPISEESEGMALSRGWLKSIDVSPARAAIIDIRGDSMIPTIADGARVILQRTQEMTGSGIYVFSRDGEVSVKRLMPFDEGRDGRPRALAVIADNTTYPPITLVGDEMNDIRLIGRVRYVLTPV